MGKSGNVECKKCSGRGYWYEGPDIEKEHLAEPYVPPPDPYAWMKDKPYWNGG